MGCGLWPLMPASDIEYYALCETMLQIWFFHLAVDQFFAIECNGLKNKLVIYSLVVHVVCHAMTYLTNTQHNTQHVTNMLTKKVKTLKKLCHFEIDNVAKKDMLIKIDDIYLTRCHYL